jgi:hypothetical protein
VNSNDSIDKKSEAMARLAARVSADPFFLGELLAGYQRRHNFDEADFAAQLGCPVAVLTSLGLCRKPGAAEPQRTAERDIADIARLFGLKQWHPKPYGDTTEAFIWERSAEALLALARRRRRSRGAAF